MADTDQRAARRAAAAERARRQRTDTSQTARALLVVQAGSVLEALDRLGRAAHLAGVELPAEVTRALVVLGRWCAKQQDV